MASVFVVSREPRTCERVCGYLADRGHRSTLATTYDAAMEALRSTTFDVLVIDVQGLPRDERGATYLQFNQWLGVEFKGCQVAFIYLLHKGARKPAFRVEGTVIKKPFPLEMLGAALRAHVGSQSAEGTHPGITLDVATNTIRSVVGEARLTNIESALLAHFMAHRGEVLHPKHLLVDVWQYRDAAGANTLVRAHVSNLRRKLREAAGTDRLIQTIRGRGYRYVA